VTLRIGSLFSGYGGLDMAVAAHYGADVAWHVEFDKHPAAILAHHFPDVPNYGDVTSVDWSQVEPVDIITAGWPCQPFSHAGQRRGTNDDRHLWPYVADALRVLRPRILVGENVSGHLTLGFDTVLADLAGIGFDAEWMVVRASDAGAPHQRKRLFIVATAGDAGRPRTDAQSESGGSRHPVGKSGDDVATDAARERGDGGGDAGPRRWAEPTDRSADDDGLTLLPTPAVNDMGRGKTVEDWDAWTEAMQAKHGNGNGHGKSLEIEAQRLLPTPAARDFKDQYVDNAGCHRPGDTDSVPRAVRDMDTDFGPYTAAIRRWEQVTGRPAPSPTEPGANGRPRLSPRFVEWMMGLPDGWVTGVGIPRSAQLKALGNGVVPQQAALALAMLDPVDVAVTA
jgi:DNA (cytosine-5)-methyltransferase 1